MFCALRFEMVYGLPDKAPTVTNARDKWEAFLDPDVLRGKLISASIYIAAYEMLKESIVGRIRDFYSIGLTHEGPTIAPEYEKEVLSRNGSPLYASLAWLGDNSVIDVTDLAKFEKVKAWRNRLAHEMSSHVTGASDFGYLEQLPILAALLKKVETWWIVNVEIPVNPDMHGAEIDESGIVPGPSISLQLMIEIALGDPKQSSLYIDEFRKRWRTEDEEKS